MPVTVLVLIHTIKILTVDMIKKNTAPEGVPGTHLSRLRSRYYGLIICPVLAPNMLFLKPYSNCFIETGISPGKNGK